MESTSVIQLDIQEFPFMTVDRVAIVASAQVELRRAWSGAQHVDLISAVVASVFKGTGLSLDDVDFVIDSGSDVLDGRSISNCGFLGALGAHHKEESRVEEDGLWAASYGVVKIAAGAANLGLIVAYSKPSESDVNLFYKSQVEPFYQRPVGFDHRAASGIQAQRYLAQAGATKEQLAELVVRRWKDATQYANVDLGQSPSVADVLTDDAVATPLSGLMMSQPADGAVAILVASEDLARKASHCPVWITGMGDAADAHAFASRPKNRLAACEVAAAAALKRAGWKSVTPAVAEISASSAVTEAMVSESIGLKMPGQGLVLDSGQPTVINRSGGALPADPIMATGLIRLSEAVQQLVCPEKYDLVSPTSALVHGSGGVGMQTHCVMTLEV